MKAISRMNRTLATAITLAVLGFTALAPTAATAADMTEAEVRKLDMDTGKVTLKHGEIKSLDMPPMTMVFTAQNKGQLAPLKVGDKVLFKAVHETGKYVVTDIQLAK